jgi:2-dehydropantoate 2-reductase
MRFARKTAITVAGAGSVGCYVGALLAASGRKVTLLSRAPLAEAIASHGIRVSDLEGRDTTLPPTALTATADASAALQSAKIVLVTVKSRDTETVAQLIKAYTAKDTVVVSLQNGVDNAHVLRRVLGPKRRVLAAMVPFNVVQNHESDGAPRFHRATSGVIRIQTGVDGLRKLLNVKGARVAEHPDIDAVMWGKLLVNLNNALNALSDLPLHQQLRDRRWRLLMSRQMREGLAVLRAAGVRPAPVEGVPPRLMAFALRLPDALFRLAARGMLAVDKNARSSMWDDLRRGRQTEIDHLQGEIVRLAAGHGIPAPLNRRVLELIKEAEEAQNGSPALSPEAISAAR